MTFLKRAAAGLCACAMMLGSVVSASAASVKVPNVSVKRASANASAVRVKWRKAKGVSGYRVYRLSNRKWKRVATVKASADNFLDKGLESNTTYKYKVKAYKRVKGKAVWGKASSVVTAKTKSAAKNGTEFSTDEYSISFDESKWNRYEAPGVDYSFVLKGDDSSKFYISTDEGRFGMSYDELEYRAKKDYDYKAHKITDSKMIKIGGYDAYELSFDSDYSFAKLSEKVVYIKGDKTLVSITYATQQGNMDKFKPEVDKALSTFRFK